MTFTSFAQNYEDVLLWRALGDVKRGTYLDIGAQDPNFDSVSLAFYKAGWRGIHVEPTPAYADRLRAARPDETVIQAAVSDDAGPISFFEIAETGISTGMASIAKVHEKSGFIPQEIQVPTITLRELLDQFDANCHWLKIDVEGMEADVLRSWGDSEKRPWVLLVESTYPGTTKPTQQEWIQEVRSRDYDEVYFDGLNRFFVHRLHKELRDRFSAPPNPFDRFDITADHVTAGGIRADLESARAATLQANSRLTEVQTIADAAQDAAKSAKLDYVRTLEKLVQSEQGHRTAVEALAADLRTAERDHRVAVQALTYDLRSAAQEALALEREHRVTVQALNEELRTAEARGAQLENSLTRAEGEGRRTQDLLDQASRGRDEALEEVSDLQARAAQLSAQIAHLSSRLALADRLIRTIASERPGGWHRLGQIFGVARPSGSGQALAAWTAAGSIQEEPQGMEHHSAAPRAGGSRNPYLRANSLDELLSWNDVDFVRCAYVTVLGRQPDPDGEDFYVERLRRGRSKFEVLHQLRFSKEARNHDPGIAGFDRALRRAALARKPVIGLFVGPPADFETNTSADRSHRALMNELARLRQDLSSGPAVRSLQQEMTELREAVQSLTRGSVPRAPAAARSAAPPVPPLDQASPQDETPPPSGLTPRAKLIFTKLS